MATAYEAAILDVDGTILRGERTIPDAADGLEALDDAGVPYLLFSNNPTRGPAHYRERLATHDVEIETDRVLTSAAVTADYLAANHPDDAVFLVGDDRLREILASANLHVTPKPTEAEVVVGSIDPEFDYDRLRLAQRALEREVPFYGTDPDVTIPGEDGNVPGSGAILAAMSAVAGRDPDAILGKPSPVAAAAALSRLDVSPAEILVVGDRLDTDVALGARAGMSTAVVLSGITSRDDLDGPSTEPDHVLESLGELSTLFDSA